MARTQAQDTIDSKDWRQLQIGQLIRSARGDLSQEALGHILGDVPQTTVSRWEKGTVDLTLEQVLQIERSLGLSLGTLATGAGYVEAGDNNELHSLIMSDQRLDPDLRLELVALYDRYVAYSRRGSGGKGRQA